MSGPVSNIARGAQLVMGLLFVAAGSIKIWEPLLFFWEAMPFVLVLGIEREMAPAGARLALGFGPLEFILGVALILNWRPRLILPASAVLLCFFTALMTYAWKIGATADCGCFGSLVNRSPGEAAVEDMAMLVLVLVAWWGGRPLDSKPTVRSTRVFAAGAIVAVAVFAFRYFPEANRAENSDLQVGVDLNGLSLDGVDLDLAQGRFVVALFSPTCGRCQKEVPTLNEFQQVPDLPSVIALTSFPAESKALTKFKEHLRPTYEIATISLTDFRRLTYNHGYPRLAYVDEGVVQAVWEYFQLPDVNQLRRAVMGPQAPHDG
jgi:thiol-disulfide isomerase/thioredoxin